MRLLVLTILVGILISGCGNKAESILLNFEITKCEWEQSDPEHRIAKPCDVQSKDLRVGQSFETFVLESINNLGQGVIRFSDEYVVAGEDINHLSVQNPRTIEKRTCFRTRTIEKGHDVCFDQL